MTDKHNRWLLRELEVWRRDGLVSDDQAAALAHRYTQSNRSTSWALFLFFGVGVVIIGLGIILFFAYNWQDMGKAAKLLLVFGGIVLAHLLGWYFNMVERHRNRALGEGLQLLGTMLFGAGIWLIAQIYHIDEHYPNGLLIWSLGALAMAWAVPSIFQGLLALFLLFMWSWFEIFDFQNANYMSPWLVAALIVPLAWQLRSRVLLFFSLALLPLLFALNLTQMGEDTLVTSVFAVACLYLAAGKLVQDSPFPDSAPVIMAVGNAIYILLLFLLSFGEITGDLLNGGAEGRPYWALSIGAAAIAWGWVLVRHRSLLPDIGQRIEAGLILSALVTMVLTALGIPFGQLFLFNLVFLAHGFLILIGGMQLLRWQPVALGGAMIAALVFARFLDLFDSLLGRSLTFLILGSGIVAIGLIYTKLKRARKALPPATAEVPNA